MRPALSPFAPRLVSLFTLALGASIVLGAAGCAMPSQPDGTDGENGAAARDPKANGHLSEPTPLTVTASLEAERAALDPHAQHDLERTRLETARLPPAATPAAALPKPETTISMPFYVPNITAVRDDRSVWKYDARYGWYPAIATGFTINNVGSATSAGFRVSILNGSASRGFDVGPMAPHASNYYELTTEIGCGSSAVVIADPFNAIWESSYSDNVATVPGVCYW